MPSPTFDMKVDPIILEVKAQFQEDLNLRVLNAYVPNKNLGDDTKPFEPDTEATGKIISRLNETGLYSAQVSEKNPRYIEITKLSSATLPNRR